LLVVVGVGLLSEEITLVVVAVRVVTELAQDYLLQQVQPIRSQSVLVVLLVVEMGVTHL
jgi:hypothetical protein